MSEEHIKLSEIKPSIQYVADGVQTAFTYVFPIFDVSDMAVYRDEQRQASGFTVSGAGLSDGGEVLFDTPPAVGSLVTLRREIPLERTSDFQQGGELRAKVLNDELDYLVASLQQLDERQGRGLSQPVFDAAVDMTLPVAEERAGKVLGFDSEGVPVVDGAWNEASAQAAASAAAAAVSEANASTSETNAAASAAAAAQSAADAANHTHTLADITDSGALAAKDSIATADVDDGAITQSKIDPAVQLGGPSLGTNSIIRTNANTISEDITIPAGNNGMSAGPVSVGYLNELTWSDAFDNADWTKTGCTVWANAVASPTGTGGAADKLEEDSSTGFHYVYQNVPTTIGLPYTASVYVKPLQRTRVNLRFASGANVGLLKVNLNDGSLVSYSGSGDPDAGYVIEDAGGGWWRIAVTERAAATSTTVAIYMVDNAGSASYGGTNPEGLYLWGAQLTALPILTDPAPSTSVLPGATLTIADGATYTVV